MNLRTFVASLPVLLVLALSGQSAAAAFPERPIRLVIPFPPGGSTDLIGRLVAKGMTERLGQQVVVENLAGAAGALGVQTIARAEPDGYSYVFTVSGPITLVPSVNKSVRYSLDDLEPVGIVFTSPLILVVPANSPWKSFEDLLAAGKAGAKSEFNFGSSGVGAISHVAAEMINLRAGTTFQHIPYKGTADTLRGMAMGDVHWGLIIGVDAKGPVADGRLKALVSLDHERSPNFPTVPTLQERGFNIGVSVWYGMFAPRQIPRPIRDQLNRTLRETLADPGIARRIQELGADVRVRDNTPEAIKPALVTERDAYQQVVKTLNIKLD